jgi:hypothetical protein
MSKLIPGALLVAALSSCAGATGTATNPFAGTWTCDETLAPSGGVAGPVTAAVLSISAPGTDQIAAATQIRLGAACSLHFATSGTSAVLNSGQSCTLGSGATLSYSGGNATLSGSAFTASLSYDLTAQDDAGAPLTGSGTETFTCTRVIAPSGGGGPPSGGGW